MRRKILFIGVGVLLALLISAAVLHINAEMNRHAFEESLAAKIRLQMTGDSATFNFKAVTDFDWDHLFIFGPYVSKTQIERTLGTKWTGSLAIESGKGINLLVFMKDGSVVRYAELSRIVDFVLPACCGGWTDEQANFELKRDGNRLVAKPHPEKLKEIKHNDESGRLESLEFVDSLGKTAKWVWFYPNGKPKVETEFNGSMRHGVERGYDEEGVLKFEGEWCRDTPWTGWCYVLFAGDAGSWAGLRHWQQFENGKLVKGPQDNLKVAPDGSKQ